MARGGNSECKLYIGDLARDASEKDVERAFSYYGPLRSVWVARNPPGFAFVEFEDVRDADDAVRGLDGTHICGVRCRVEHSTGKTRPKPWLRGGDGGRDGGRDRYGGGRDRYGGGRDRYGGGRDRDRDGGGRRRAFDPKDRCYECGDRGHYAYDCPKHDKGSRRSRSRSNDRGGRRRSYTRSRSRSRGTGHSRSRTPRSRSRTPYRSRSRSLMRSRSRSKSPAPAMSPKQISPSRD